MPRSEYFGINFRQRKVEKVKATSKIDAEDIFLFRNRFRPDLILSIRQWEILKKLIKNTK